MLDWWPATDTAIVMDDPIHLIKIHSVMVSLKVTKMNLNQNLESILNTVNCDYYAERRRCGIIGACPRFQP